MNWREQIQQWQNDNPICKREYWYENNYVNPYCFMEVLSKYLSKGAIIIPDTGATLCWSMQGIIPQIGQRIFTQWNMASMGYAICACIGAYFAAPRNQIIVLTGDGGIHMNIQELETIKYHKIPVKIFVFNNKEYGIINQTFDTWNLLRVGSDEKSGLGFPDFKRIADAYEIDCYQIKDHSNFYLIETALSSNKPTMIILNIKKGQMITPKLKAGQRLEEIQ